MTRESIPKTAYVSFILSYVDMHCVSVLTVINPPPPGNPLYAFHNHPPRSPLFGTLQHRDITQQPTVSSLAARTLLSN